MISPSKFFESRQTLNTDRLSQNIHNTQIKRTVSEVFINPYPSKPLLKFPKNKTVRRQTQMSTIIESTLNPQKPTIRTCGSVSKTTLDDMNNPKRIAKYGQYNPLASKSSESKQTQPRTFEDLGIKSNKKKVQYPLKYRPDSIIHSPMNQTPRQLNKVWNENRKLRDHGIQARQTLTWKVDSAVKKSFYQHNQQKSSLSSSSVSFIETLNYSRRR